ncbi:hypothetical protein MHYP_G00300090 [Metynnis hypsauchen]
MLVKLTCSSTCNLSAAYYNWYRNGYYKIYSYTPSTVLDSTSASNEGSYSCEVHGNSHRSPPVCVLGKECWGVTYTPECVCALKGSSVDLSCSYKHPGGHTVTKSVWFIKEQAGAEPVDVREDEEYQGRVQYRQSSQNDCSMRITHLRERDAQTYRFRFHTDGDKYTGEPGVTLSVTDLKVTVSDTHWSETYLMCSSTCTLSNNPTYIWYMNGQPVIHCKSASCSVAVVSGEVSYSCAVEGHENLRSPPMYSPRNTSVVIIPSGERVEGDSVTLSCSSDANPPVLIYSWFKQRAAADAPLTTGQNYTITNISSQHSGLYYCTAHNQLGQHSSTPTRLDVLHAEGSEENSVLKLIAVGVSVFLALTLITAALWMWRKKGHSSSEESEQRDTAAVYGNISAQPFQPANREDDQDDIHYSSVHFRPSYSQEEPPFLTAKLPLDSTEEEGVQYAAVNFSRHTAAPQERKIEGLKLVSALAEHHAEVLAVEQDCSPFRPENPSPELCEGDEDMQDHLHDQAELAAWIARSMGSIVHSTEVKNRTPMEVHSPVDSCTPEELRALPFLYTPVPPPAADKPRRLSRQKSLLMGAKDGNKTNYTPGRIICRLRDLVRQRRNAGEGHVESADSRNAPEVAELSQERRSETQLDPTGNKPAAFRQMRGADSHIKPVESRAAPKAVEVSQGRAETLETPALISEQPLKNPELALRQTVKLLQDEEWERKIEGLKLVSALAEHHTEVLLPELHDICLIVIQEVKNLRSMVSRAAMSTLAHLYVHLQRKMDQEVESTACVLLHKAGESSQFIREDVEAALSTMVQNCSPGRVLHALLTGGLSHRNAAVRRCTAQHLEKLACLLGASRLLNGKKDFTCRFLTAISKLALDSAQEVRLHARSTLRFLGGHKDFLKMVEKFVPPRDKTSIKDIITKSRSQEEEGQASACGYSVQRWVE